MERPVRVGCNACNTAFQGNHNDAFVCADITYSFAVAVTDFLDTDHLLSSKFIGTTPSLNSSLRGSAF